MSRYLDISKLADDVLASVAEPRVEKVAADSSNTQSDIGRLLKTAAADIRTLDDRTVTDEDIQELVSGVKKHAEATAGATLGALSGSSAGGAMGGGGGGLNPINASAPGPAPSNPMGQVAPKLGSVAGQELRKMAAQLRDQGEANTEQRLVKAAQMISAATGLKHLTSTLTKG